MMSRPSRAIMRTMPTSSQAALLPTLGRRFASSKSKASAKLHTSSANAVPSPAFVEYGAPRGRGMTPEAKQRVREHVRRIQSSAVTSEPAAAVRPPNPTPSFQTAPPAQKAADSRLAAQGNPAIKDGYDHS
jgi:acetolactate synthase-1/2/3 large subunit